jgi:hypothetical protein
VRRGRGSSIRLVQALLVVCVCVRARARVGIHARGAKLEELWKFTEQFPENVNNKTSIINDIMFA